MLGNGPASARTRGFILDNFAAEVSLPKAGFPVLIGRHAPISIDKR